MKKSTSYVVNSISSSLNICVITATSSSVLDKKLKKALKWYFEADGEIEVLTEDPTFESVQSSHSGSFVFTISFSSEEGQRIEQIEIAQTHIY